MSFRVGMSFRVSTSRVRVSNPHAGHGTFVIRKCSKMFTFITLRREGSVIADMEATLIDHPVAEPIFFARLSNVDFGRLFDGRTELRNVPRE